MILRSFLPSCGNLQLSHHLFPCFISVLSRKEFKITFSISKFFMVSLHFCYLVPQCLILLVKTRSILSSPFDCTHQDETVISLTCHINIYKCKHLHFCFLFLGNHPSVNKLLLKFMLREDRNPLRMFQFIIRG